MADHARNKLDEMIAQGVRTEQMLGHIADQIKSTGPDGSEVYHTDVLAALLHAKSITRRHTQNLEHVRAVYDAKVVGIDGL